MSDSDSNHNSHDAPSNSSPINSRSGADSDIQSSLWTRIEPHERRAVGWATSWFFLILLGYFIVRPVRETMGTIGGTKELQYLFLYVFLAMLFAVPLYSALVARLPRRWLVRVVFHFFAVCLLVFSLLLHFGAPDVGGQGQVQDDQVQVETPGSLQTPRDVEEEEVTAVQRWTARVFFIWVSVFGVFSTSVFWSVLTDIFTSKQGRRLFGIVAAGGTAGAIVGSLLTSQIAKEWSTGTLLLLPVAIIETGLWCAWRLEKQAAVAQDRELSDQVPETAEATGGGLLAGITHVISSSYLASICLFLFFVQACGTLLYFEQAEIVSASFPETEEGLKSRTQLFAYIDLGAQVITLFIQVGVSGIVLRRLGVSAALIMLPIMYAIGFVSLAISPTLGVLIVVVILGRAMYYGITVPTREVLFTVVAREDKYKSKSFIDTVVLRGGDMASGQIFGVLRSVMGYSIMQLNAYVLPFVGIWAATAWQLGRRQKKLANIQLRNTEGS